MQLTALHLPVLTKILLSVLLVYYQGMSLWVDLWKLQECLENSLNRLECLKECHLEENPTGLLPDFVFPLEKVLTQSLEEIRTLQWGLQGRQEKFQALLNRMKTDPEMQELMSRLAESEKQDRKD